MENIFALLKQGSQAYNQTAATAGKLPFTSVAPVTEVLPNGQVSVAASEYGGISTTPPLYRACPTFGLTFPSPRIGDTVVYSYLDGDPNQGVYWGHLQNNLNPPGLTDRFSYVLGNSIVVIQETQIDVQCTKCNLQVTEEKITASVGELTIEVTEGGFAVKMGDSGAFNISGSSLDITGFSSVTIAGKEVATVGARSALQTITQKGW